MARRRGQGMTVAATAAERLGQRLAESEGQLDGVARRFQRSYPQIVEPAWLLATNADLEWLGRLAGWYLPRVLDAVATDRLVNETFLEVQHLMKPPAALFHPRIARRVLRHALRGAASWSSS